MKIIAEYDFPDTLNNVRKVSVGFEAGKHWLLRPDGTRQPFDTLEAAQTAAQALIQRHHRPHVNPWRTGHGGEVKRKTSP